MKTAETAAILEGLGWDRRDARAEGARARATAAARPHARGGGGGDATPRRGLARALSVACGQAGDRGRIRSLSERLACARAREREREREERLGGAVEARGKAFAFDLGLRRDDDTTRERACVRVLAGAADGVCGGWGERESGCALWRKEKGRER
jgi:hypothetical protein